MKWNVNLQSGTDPDGLLPRQRALPLTNAIRSKLISPSSYFGVIPPSPPTPRDSPSPVPFERCVVSASPFERGACASGGESLAAVMDASKNVDEEGRRVRFDPRSFGRGEEGVGVASLKSGFVSFVGSRVGERAGASEGIAMQSGGETFVGADVVVGGAFVGAWCVGGEFPLDQSAESRFFSPAPAKGTLRIAVGRLFAASFALDVASSLASFAAALAPSGPVIIFVLLVMEFSVERVTIGESVVGDASWDKLGERDVLEDGEPERRGGEVVMTERETGGTEVEGFLRWTNTLNSVPLNSARGAAEMTSDPSETSFSKCPIRHNYSAQNKEKL